MAETISVGILRATLAADTAKWTMGLREASSSLSSFEKQTKKTTDSIVQGMGAAGKAASDSAKLIAGMGAAGQQASAQVQAAMQQQSQKAAEWQKMLQQSAAASAQAEKSFNQMSQSGSKAGNVLLGVAAVIGTINFGAAAAQAAEATSRIQDAAERMQISTEAVQRLGFAAEQSGGSLEAVATAMGRMAETLGSADADKKLQAIGLSLEKVKGLNSEQTFVAIAEALRKIPDPLRQADQATNFFGRTALPLLPAIRAGFLEVGKAAPVMSDAVIKSGDRVGDKLHEIEVRMNNLKAEALLPFADFFTKNLPNSVQVGIAGLSNFIPSLEALTLGVLAFGGPSGAWKAMVTGFGAISLAAKGAIASFWPLAAAIAAVWAAWKIGNTETVKNSIATWALSSDNLTAKLFRAVGGIDQMSEAQARAAVNATAAAEKSREMALATEQVDKAMAAALAPTANLTDQLSEAKLALAGLTAEQRENIAAGLAMGHSIAEVAKELGIAESVVQLYKTSVTDAAKASAAAAKATKDAAREAAEAHREWSRVVAANEKILEQQGKEAEKFFQQERKIAEASADAMLKSIKARADADKELTKVTRDQERERAEFAIEMAEKQGASWQELYEMQRQLSETNLQHAIRDAEEEFIERTRWIDRTTQFGEAEYQALRAVHDANINGMLETHQRAEAAKRAELERTHNKWLQLIDRVKGRFAELGQELTSNLGSLFFNLGFDIDGSLRKTADAAAKSYEDVQKSAEKTTNEIAADFGKATSRIKEDAKAQMERVEEAFLRVKNSGTASAEDIAEAWRIHEQEKERINAETNAKIQEATKKRGEDEKKVADEIHQKFEEMRKAEDEAHRSWGERFIEVWHSIKRALFDIFNDILGMFVNSFLNGMLGAIMGKQGAFSQAFAGLFGGMAGSGGAAGGIGGAAGNAGILGAIGGLFGIGGANASAAGVLAGNSAIAGAMASGAGAAGVAGAAGAAAGGGAGGTAAGVGTGIGLGSTLAITGGIAGAALLAWAVVKKGLFRGGEEALDVSPARDEFFGGFQQQFGGSQFEAMAAAFAASGVSGDIAEKLIADLYSADQMEEFRSATQAIQDALAAGADASVTALETAAMADKAIVQLNATLAKVEATGDVSEEAIAALRQAIDSLKNSNVSADAIEALNKTLTQMIAEGTASDEAIGALITEIEQMTASGGDLQTQVEDTTTATGQLEEENFKLEGQLSDTGDMTWYLKGTMNDAEGAAGSFASELEALRSYLSQPIQMPQIVLPDIQLPNYSGGGDGGNGDMAPWTPPDVPAPDVPSYQEPYYPEPQYPDFQSFANEGIARSPMLAMVGDAAEPEWILHQSSVKGLMSRAFAMGASMLDGLTGGMDMSGTTVRSGGDTFNVTAQIRIDGAGKNGATLAQELVTELPRALRRNHELVRNLRTAVAT